MAFVSIASRFAGRFKSRLHIGWALLRPSLMRNAVIVGGIGLASVVFSFGAGCGRNLESDTQRVYDPRKPEDLGFHELKAESSSIKVRGSKGARIDLLRTARLSYEIQYVSGSAARTTIALPVEGRINPLVDAQDLGSTTLACVNSFVDSMGNSPRVDCVLLDSETGVVRDRASIPNTWLRGISERDARAYLSPETLVHIDDEAGIVCHALAITEGGRLAYDGKTLTTCEDEAPVLLPSDPERLKASLLGLLATTSPESAPAPPSSGTVGTTLSPPVPPSPPDGGLSQTSNQAEPELVDCRGEMPKSNRTTTSLGLPKDWPGLWMLEGLLQNVSQGWVKPDAPKPGLTQGAFITASGKHLVTKDEPLCLSEEHQKELILQLNISSGTLIGLADIRYQDDGSKCGELACPDKENWTCSGPSGSKARSSLSGELQLGGSIPLDNIPWFRPFCGLGMVSCNVDMLVGGGFAKRHDEAAGKSRCGSDCPDGKATSFDQFDRWGSATGAAEVEVRLAWPGGRSSDTGGSSTAQDGTDGGAGSGRRLFAGRAGLQLEAQVRFGDTKSISCTDQHESNYSCVNARAVLQLVACPGFDAFNYCFNFRKTLFQKHSGECPPLPDLGDGSNVSPGKSAGNACVQRADRFFTMESYNDQCKNCCNGLPAPPPDIQDANEFDKDCKAQCDEAFGWSVY
jgi:hypothetical protein